MRWKHVAAGLAAGLMTVTLLAGGATGDAGVWKQDSRRPGGFPDGQGSMDAAQNWRDDMRRPADFPEGGGSMDAKESWRDDTRRPAGFPDGDGGLGRVEAWRVDPRRPADWPRGEAPMMAVDGDADGDGVMDGADRCPGTPPGATVDASGCPRDSDGDGVYDGIDQCPDTPKGATVDARGCPQDSDGDGVYDGIDQCPGTPAGTRVDEKGCPVSEKEAELLDTGELRLQDVRFDTNQATLKAESYPILDEVGAILSKWPQLRIEIGGHTDSQGAETYNQGLSERRAKAVLDYLGSKFSIQTDQYMVKGYGESAPIASNDTPEGRARNRRVVFKVLNREVLKKN
jgi:outer membrane protein OmpA-like peptidoglycan-associated protein